MRARDASKIGRPYSQLSEKFERNESKKCKHVTLKTRNSDKLRMQKMLRLIKADINRCFCCIEFRMLF